LNDFDLIEDFKSAVYGENAAAVDFLRRELRFGDIVVTHHLPAAKSVHPRFVNSPLTPFFLCDLTDLILDRQPAVWVHGHTHASLDYLLGATRIVCNPMGYSHDPNSCFEAGLLV
jgi:Icc-related predicted phosphoesterase